MSSEMKEIPDGYAFSPKPGKLYELFNYLKENGLNYQTYFTEISSGSRKATGYQLFNLAF